MLLNPLFQIKVSLCLKCSVQFASLWLMCTRQQFMAQGSLLDFPAELITLIKQRPNSSRIMRSAAAFDLPIFSACSACARRHSQVASATSLVTNVKGSLKENKTSAHPNRQPTSHSLRVKWTGRQFLLCSCCHWGTLQNRFWDAQVCRKTIQLLLYKQPEVHMHSIIGCVFLVF